MPHYVAAWTNESTGTWDLIIAEDGHFSGTDPDAHVVAEYHTSVPVSEDCPGDEYLAERGWNTASSPWAVRSASSRSGGAWTVADNAFFHDVWPVGVVECRQCGRRSDDPVTGKED